jgi:diguanylate cyclase (GGDEF)-like protein
MILPRLADAASVHTAARKMAMCVAKPAFISGEYVSVTASIGAALFDPEHDDVDTLLAKADTAMYHAKRGGVVWRVWTKELQAAAVQAATS